MSYIFVGGSQRSGTTLLQKILCSAPDSNPFIKESVYLRTLLSAYQLAVNNFDANTRDYFATPEDLKVFHAHFIRAFLQQTQNRFASARHLILKEPHMTAYFPELFELLPESKFVVVIRDPRDIIVSMLDVGQRLEKNGGYHPLFQLSKLPQMVQSIMRFYAPVLTYYQSNEAFRKVCRYIKYELLVQSPKKTIAILQQFTALNLSDFDPGAVTEGQGQVPDMNTVSDRGSFWRTELSDQAVSTQSVGRYQERLKPEHIAVIEQYALPLMKSFAYTPIS